MGEVRTNSADLDETAQKSLQCLPFQLDMV